MGATARRRRTLGAIDAILARLPTVECKGLCTEACGPVAMSKPEWERIIRRLGHAPRGDTSLVCPMLDRASGRCTVHDIRPTICRIWGVVRSMPCPFGCVPSRWLSDEEGHAILAEVERVARGA
jgi:uncharacterized protein